MTMMLGGVICGYWATGRLMAATAPANVMTTESTAAKIGRSMKKCENIWPSILGAGRSRLGALLFVCLFPCLLVSLSCCFLVCLSRLGQQLHQRRLRRLRRRLHLDLDLGARPHTLHAADDDALSLRQSLLGHPQALKFLPHRDAAIAHHVVVVD